MLSIFLLVERLLNFRYIPNQRLFCGRFIFSIRFTKSFCFDEVGQRFQPCTLPTSLPGDKLARYHRSLASAAKDCHP